MPNGKIGDHPYTDIVIHRRDHYSPRAAGMIREIHMIADERTRHQLADTLWKEFGELSDPDVPKLEKLLEEMLENLKRDARARGYEIE